MFKKQVIFVVALAVSAIILFPLGMINFIAAENALTKVTLNDNGDIREFVVGASTVEGFFYEAGIMRDQSDRISHSLNAYLWDGMTITIERGILFYTQINGGTLIVRAAPPDYTVEDIIIQMQNESEITLMYDGDLDKVVEFGDILRFETMMTNFETEIIPIPYETIENRTNAVSEGRQNLRVPGEDGEQEVITSVVYIGGVEDSRGVVSNRVILEPTNAILDIGTGWLGSLTNTNSPEFHYYRRIVMEATAYTAGYCCTGKSPGDPWYGITASGRPVQHGIVAVDRSIIPLGTRLYVEGYGYAIAADVGGAIQGNKIDLFMFDLSDALRFGRRHINVWVLDEI